MNVKDSLNKKRCNSKRSTGGISTPKRHKVAEAGEKDKDDEMRLEPDLNEILVQRMIVE